MILYSLRVMMKGQAEIAVLEAICICVTKGVNCQKRVVNGHEEALTNIAPVRSNVLNIIRPNDCIHGNGEARNSSPEGV